MPKGIDVRVLLIHPGTQYAHRLAFQLARCGLLFKFITGIAFTSNSFFVKALPIRLRRKIANRVLPSGISSTQLSTRIWSEFSALIRLYRGRRQEEVFRLRNRQFQRSIGVKEMSEVDVVIGFDTSSLIAMEMAARTGIPYVLDQSIAHPLLKEKVYSELRDRYPLWQQDLLAKDPMDVIHEQEEHALAKRIVVASTFTKLSLVKYGVPESKIRVNPYGVSENFFIECAPRKTNKVRWLYLGLLGARKGLPFLLDVWKSYRLFDTSELWLAGPANQLARESIEGVPGVKYLGRLTGSEVPAVMSSCDGLVFPSFFEGFGQVILEAMAAGLPVLTTEATAGPDIIDTGKDGMVIPTGNTAMWGEAMSELSKDRVKMAEMGRLAVQKARKFTWEAYGDRWKEILQEIRVEA